MCNSAWLITLMLSALALGVCCAVGASAQAAPPPGFVIEMSAADIAKVAQAEGGVTLSADGQAAVTSATTMRVPVQAPWLGKYIVEIERQAGYGPCAAFVDGVTATDQKVTLAEGTEFVEIRGQAGQKLGIHQLTVIPSMRAIPAIAWAPGGTAPGQAALPPEMAGGMQTYVYVASTRKVALVWSDGGPTPVQIWVNGQAVPPSEAGTRAVSGFYETQWVQRLVNLNQGWNLVVVQRVPAHNVTLVLADYPDMRFAHNPGEGDMIIAADAERANFAQAFLNNGLVKLSVYLPNSGFYRGPRFDWSGMIHRVEYQGHNYFDNWQDPHDPWTNDGGNGTSEEFGMGAFGEQPPLGYTEAAPGEYFVKVGVGVLLRSNSLDNGFWYPYKVVDSPPWEVTHGDNWVQFRQVVHGPRGWAYDYTKRISLVPGKAQFVIYHRLKNIGTKPIEQPNYCHNFFHIDHTPTGPSYVMTYAFVPQVQSDPLHIALVNGHDLSLKRDLAVNEPFFSLIQGYEPSVANNSATVTNTATGASVHVQGDHPVVVMPFYANDRVFCPEPNITVTAAPGQEMEWNLTYTLSAK